MPSRLPAVLLVVLVASLGRSTASTFAGATYTDVNNTNWTGTCDPLGKECTIDCRADEACTPDVLGNVQLTCPTTSDCTYCELLCDGDSACAGSVFYGQTCNFVNITLSSAVTTRRNSIAKGLTIHPPGNGSLELNIVGDLAAASDGGYELEMAKIQDSRDRGGPLEVTINCRGGEGSGLTTTNTCKNLILDTTFSQISKLNCKEGADCRDMTVYCPVGSHAKKDNFTQPCQFESDATSKIWGTAIIESEIWYEEISLDVATGGNSSLNIVCTDSGYAGAENNIAACTLTPSQDSQTGQDNGTICENTFGSGCVWVTTTTTIPPSSFPSLEPSVGPTGDPTARPSYVPTTEPSNMPSVIPTVVPTDLPSRMPFATPTLSPTDPPTKSPTGVPTTPTLAPVVVPTTPSPTNGTKQLEGTTDPDGVVVELGTTVFVNQTSENEGCKRESYDEVERSEFATTICVLAFVLSLIILIVIAMDACMRKVRDTADYRALLVYIQNVVDNILDCWFAAAMYLKCEMGYFGASLAFILIQGFCSMILFWFWTKHLHMTQASVIRRLRKYLNKYSAAFFALSVFASFCSALALIKSQLFGLEVFHFPLKRSEYNLIKLWKFFNVTLLQNIPLLAIKIMYLDEHGTDDSTTVFIVGLALFSTSLSMTFAGIQAIGIGISAVRKHVVHSLVNSTTRRRMETRLELACDDFVAEHTFCSDAIKTCLLAILYSNFDKQNTWGNREDVSVDVEVFFIEYKMTTNSNKSHRLNIYILFTVTMSAKFGQKNEAARRLVAYIEKFDRNRTVQQMMVKMLEKKLKCNPIVYKRHEVLTSAMASMAGGGAYGDNFEQDNLISRGAEMASSKFRKGAGQRSDDSDMMADILDEDDE